MKKSNDWSLNFLFMVTLLFATTAIILDIYSTLKINNNHNILSVLKNKTNANGELLSLGPKKGKKTPKRILGCKNGRRI